MYYITLDHETCIDYGIYVVKRPSMPSPERVYKDLDIPGMDGMLYIDMETYKDLEIQIEFNYMIHEDMWHAKWRECKKWLLRKGERKLILSDDSEFFYIVKKVILDSNSRSSLRIGSFTCTFIVDPYAYLLSGLETLRPSGYIRNMYDVCKPTYMIAGEGMCTLTVNGHAMKMNVGNNVTIDTRRKLAYRTDGSVVNTSVSGKYDDLILLEGNNEISCTKGFELKVMPNWRCI